MIHVFALYVHSLPPAITIERLEESINSFNMDAVNRGVTFEEAMQAEMMNDGGAEPEEDVVNLDGDSL